jgi:hypothetical protein
MQVLMWVMLCAAVGLAALVDWGLRRAQSVPMSDAILDGPISFRMPANWQLSSATDPGGISIHQAVEPGGTGRRLTFIRQRVDRLMPPLEYLVRTDQFPQNADDADYAPITLGGFPGLCARWTAVRLSADAPAQPITTVCCCAVLPSRQAFTLRMETPGVMDKSDWKLIRQVLQHVTLANLQPTSATTVDFSEGIRIAVPDDFVLFPEPDPLRHQGTMVHQTSRGGWLLAQFVPVVFNSDLPSGWLLSALAAREQLDWRDPAQTEKWLNADLIRERDDRWRIDPRDSANPAILIHRRAYLIASKTSQGLLIVLTAQYPSGETDLDQAFDALHDKIQLDGSVDLKALLSAGAAGAEAAPVQEPGEQWWLWSRSGVAEGWTHAYVDPSGQTPVRDTLRRDWQGNVTRVSQRWGLGAGPASSWGQTARYDSQTEEEPTFVAGTRFADPITTSLRMRSGQEYPASMPPTPAFVSSAHFPGLLATIRQLPTALWTDRFPGNEAEAFAAPILLLIRRGPDAGPLRCVEVQIDGTGQISRWFFRPDGALDHADLPGQLTLRPSTAAAIESALRTDPRLTLRGR